MKIAAAIAALLWLGTGPAWADPQEIQPPSLSPPDTWVPVKAGVIRVLNKIDTRVSRMTLAVGQTQQVETLSITLVSCYVRPQDLPADAAARVKIHQNRADSSDFEGWMLKNEPGMSVFEDPIFDVHVESCQ